MKSLADVLQQNKFITEVIFKGCKTKRLIKDQIINEMVKNKQIMKVFQNELVEMELTRKEGKQDLTELNLSNKKISNLDFLAKLC